MFATIGLLICAPALAYFLAKWLFQRDTEKENKKKRAAEVAAIYKRRGLEDLPLLLINYSVTDISGVIHGFVDIIHRYVMVKDDEVESQIDRVFSNMYKAAAQSEAGRALLAKLATETPA